MSEARGVNRKRHGILLLAHGTPDSPDEIPAYLANITGGRPMPESAVEEIRRRYNLIGHSPLTQWTLRQAQLLQDALGLPVYVGMRNWKPYIADTVRRMRMDGIEAAVAICLAPQNSRTSVGLYRKATFAETGNAMEIEFVEGWADHPLLAEAFAERLKPVWAEAFRRAGRRAVVLFTAHSVPCGTIQSAPRTEEPGKPDPAPKRHLSPMPDPYPVEAKRTAANVAALLQPEGLTGEDWFFAFQSQGMAGGPWIGPTVEDTLTGLSRQGRSLVVIQPIGFLCDHVEILYDIDIAFREFASGIGLEIVRPPSLNDSPRLIEALADLARERLPRLRVPAGAAAHFPKWSANPA